MKTHYMAGWAKEYFSTTDYWEDVIQKLASFQPHVVREIESMSLLSEIAFSWRTKQANSEEAWHQYVGQAKPNV